MGGCDREQCLCCFLEWEVVLCSTGFDTHCLRFYIQRLYVFWKIKTTKLSSYNLSQYDVTSGLHCRNYVKRSHTKMCLVITIITGGFSSKAMLLHFTVQSDILTQVLISVMQFVCCHLNSGNTAHSSETETQVAEEQRAVWFYCV